MKKYIPLYIIIVGSLLSPACYYDKKDQIYPQAINVACDTTSSTYTAVVAPIIAANCANCHASSNAKINGAGIVLDSYVSIKPYVSNNFLLNSILQNGTVKAMPLNAPKMNACNINKIAAWINAGALNN